MSGSQSASLPDSEITTHHSAARRSGDGRHLRSNPKKIGIMKPVTKRPTNGEVMRAAFLRALQTVTTGKVVIPVGVVDAAELARVVRTLNQIKKETDDE